MADENTLIAWVAKMLWPLLSLQSWPNGEDSEVDLGHKRQAASKEVHYRGRNGLVELEQSLQVDLVVLVQQLFLFAG